MNAFGYRPSPLNPDGPYSVAKEHVSARTWRAVVLDSRKTYPHHIAYRATAAGWTQTAKNECLEWIRDH